MLDHGVIFFRDQEMTLQQQVDFGRRFGDLHIHPKATGAEGFAEVIKIYADENSTRAVGDMWHSDVSCEEEPPMASILRIVEAPQWGGDTLFANMAAAYDLVPQPIQEMIIGLTATHTRGDYAGEKGLDPTARVASHPVVRTHPETGRRTLFVNEAFTRRIDGLPTRESDVLLRMLTDYARDANIQCRFRWRPNSVAMWDNRAVQHLAVFDYHPAVRLGYRVTVQGDRPFFRP